MYSTDQRNHSKIRSVVEMRELGLSGETGLLFATMYLKHRKEDTGNKVAY